MSLLVDHDVADMNDYIQGSYLGYHLAMKDIYYAKEIISIMLIK